MGDVEILKGDSTNLPLVSVIMPLYNKKPYVLRSIESVKAQTYGNWELIVVDDGSTDGSLDEVPKEDGRIRVFRQENKGPGAARNRGVELASGEYVTFIDADDVYFPHKLETEMRLLWQERRAEWLMSAYEYEIGSEVRTLFIKDNRRNDVGRNIFVSENAYEELAVEGWPSDGICMRKSLFQRQNGFSEYLRYGEITEFEIRCALAEPKMVICQTPLYRVVDVPKSTSRNVQHRIENMRQMADIYHRLSQEYPRYSTTLAMSSRESFYAYASTLSLRGQGLEAREHLTKHFPHARDKRWWKMWVGSWIPVRILRQFVELAPELRES